MKNLLIIFFTLFVFNSSFACGPLLIDNIEYSFDHSLFVNQDVTSNVRNYRFYLQDDFEEEFRISASMMGLSYKIYNSDLNCSKNGVVLEDNDIGTEIYIDLNGLSKNQYYLIEFSSPITSSAFISMKKNAISTSYCSSEYNYSNSELNPLELTVDSDNYSFQDCNVGILKKKGKYSKWYKLMDSPFNEYVSIELIASPNLKPRIDLYFYSNKKWNRVNVNHLYNGRTDTKIPFVYLGDDKSYYLEVSKDESSNQNYEIIIEKIATSYDVNKLSKDTLIVGKYTTNSTSSNIKVGDTIYIEYQQTGWLPFSQTWFHSLTFEDHVDLESIDIMDAFSSTPHYSGKYLNDEDQLQIDSFPVGSYKGEGLYFLNERYGPLGYNPNFTWGLKPLISSNDENIPQIKLRKYFVINENFDCENSSILELNVRVNTDYETGIYDFENVPVNWKQVQFEVECCDDPLSPDEILMCHGENTTITIDSKDEFFPFISEDDQVKLTRIARNEYQVDIIDTTASELGLDIDFYSNNDCDVQRKFSLTKLEKKVLEIYPFNMYGDQYAYNENHIENAKSIQWSINGKSISNEEVVQFKHTQENELLELRLVDENDCALSASEKLDRNNFDLQYDFMINPNPTIKNFSLDIVSLNDLVTLGNEKFALKILLTNGEVVEKFNSLSVGSNRIVTSLLPGNYYCQLFVNDNNIATKALIIVQ